MALVRILVDGYSLLHGWPELAPGQARHSASARDELVQLLTHYQDAAGSPVTIFLDGRGTAIGPSATRSAREVEILYSGQGQTADQMIERTTHRLLPHGEVLVVTDDRTEADTVVNLGGMAASVGNFIRMIGDALGGVQRDINNHNRRERHRFKNSP
jgi:uncharacterized protein